MTLAEIVPVDGPELTLQAQELFRQYGTFLRRSLACGSFDHAKFELEIASLPCDYSERGGAVLLAMDQAQACGCIAYRACFEADTCEIKRLYVAPGARGRGVARALVSDVLQRLREQGCKQVLLDTDIDNMPGAERLYIGLGFREYGTRQGSIAFFALIL